MFSNNRIVNGHLTAGTASAKQQNNRMSMKDILERIDMRMKALGLTENALSQRAGMSRDAIRNWRRRMESGDTKAGATVTALAGVARELGVSETWLIHGIGDEPERAPTPVAGRVGAGAKVPLHDATPDGGLFKVSAPTQLLRRGKVEQFAAVEVEGDSMEPMYQPGDILFYTRATHEGIPNEDLGRPCIVEDTDGNAWIKQVRTGDEPGLFHLISLNPRSDTRHNQRIKWAARVMLALPADMVERV